MKILVIFMFLFVFTPSLFGNDTVTDFNKYGFSLDSSLGVSPVWKARATFYYFTEAENSYHLSFSLNLGDTSIIEDQSTPTVVPLDEDGYTLMLGKDWHFRGKYFGTILSLNGGGTIVNSHGRNYEDTKWEYFLNAHLDATAEAKFLIGPFYLFLEMGTSIPVYTQEPEKYKYSYIERDEQGNETEIEKIYKSERATDIRMALGLGFIF